MELGPLILPMPQLDSADCKDHIGSLAALQKGGTPVHHTGVEVAKPTNHLHTGVPPLMLGHLSARTQVVCTQVASALRWPGLRWST